jgi:hypothetical protein
MELDTSDDGMGMRGCVRHVSKKGWRRRKGPAMWRTEKNSWYARYMRM